METFRGVELFVRVVELGSFSEAARALSVSRSVVSDEIGRLERRLGVRLLNRTTRRLGLTEAGELFHARSVSALTGMRDARDEATRLQVEAVGVLKVAVSAAFGSRHVAPAAAAFLREHPGLKIEMNFADRFVDLVSEGYDVAVRSAVLADSQLIARRLVPNRMVFCATTDYLERQGTPKIPLDLERHNFLQYDPKWPHLMEWLLTVPDEIRPTRISGNFVANNLQALRQAVLAGLGAALVPTFLVSDDLREGALRMILPEWPVSRGNFYALFPHREPLPVKTRMFVEFLADRFGVVPSWDASIFKTAL